MKNSKKVDINDPKLWQSIDWDEPQQPDLLKKTDEQIARQEQGRRLKHIRGESWLANKNKAQREYYSKEENLEAQKKRIEAIWKDKEKALENIQMTIEKREQNESYKIARKQHLKNILIDPLVKEKHHKNIIQNVIAKFGILVCPAGYFFSQPEAAKALKVTTKTIGCRLKSKPNEYYYISKEEYTRRTGREL